MRFSSLWVSVRCLAVSIVLLTLGALPACSATTATAAPADNDGAFRLVVFPDTQNASDRWPEVLEKSAAWVVDNRQKLNIKYVLHVGDIVDRGAEERQWVNFDKAFSKLDEAKVPYAIVPGNHDMVKGPEGSTNTRGLTAFNRHFPLSRLEKSSGFAGHFPANTGANSYHTFRAGGTNWLILTISWAPAADVLEWANKVVAAHPNHQVILLTHSYLEHKGRDVSGNMFWEKLVTKHPNVSVVVCGHLSTVHYADTTPSGTKVYQMLFDWQNPGSPDPNSYVSILEFDPNARKLSVRTYSATLDKYLTDGRAQFEFTDTAFPKTPPAPAMKVEFKEATSEPK